VSIITKRELWATNAHHLNDAREFRYALSLLRNEAERRVNAPGLDADSAQSWSALINEWEEELPRTDSCVISFSTNGNQLSQWRAYCPKGSGYSIGFSFADLRPARKATRALMVKCVYEPGEQRDLILAVARYVEDSWRRAKRFEGWNHLGFLAHINRKVSAAMLAIKDKGFKEESEWRLVVSAGRDQPVSYRSGRFGIMPYYVVPLCGASEKLRFEEIYIGPNTEPMVARDALMGLLLKNAQPPRLLTESIKVSEIPFRY